VLQGLKEPLDLAIGLRMSDGGPYMSNSLRSQERPEQAGNKDRAVIRDDRSRDAEGRKNDFQLMDGPFGRRMERREKLRGRWFLRCITKLEVVR
jgi:hypothetical protein